MTEQDTLSAIHRFALRVASWLTPRRFLLAFVLAATSVVYIGTLEFGFVFDDHEQIVENPFVQSWRFLPQYFTTPLWNQFSPALIHNYYRPLFQIWLRINYALFGTTPWGWHMTSVLAHVLITWMVYLLARRLTGDLWTATLTTLVFGLHPTHIESVAWVSGVPEPLLALFLIPAFLCYLRWRESHREGRKWFVVSLLLYVLAMLAKETAVVFPLLIFSYEWIYKSREPEQSNWRFRLERFRGALLAVLPYVVFTAGYLMIRVIALGKLGSAIMHLPWSTVAFTLPSLLGFYIRHLLWPFGLSLFYDTPYIDHPNLWNFALPLAGVAGAVVLLGWYGKRYRAVAFASAWMLFPLLPVLNIPAFIKGEIAHDRYLYLPSVGFSIVVALALRRLNWGHAKVLGQPAVQVAAAGLLAGIMGVGTVYQSFFWRSDLDLSNRGVKIAPNNMYAWNNLGRGWAELGVWSKAEQPLLKTLEMGPTYWDPNYNLGLIYFKQGRYLEAERYLARAIKINSADSREYMVLGGVEREMSRLDLAATYMRRAIELSPEAPGYHFDLGMVFKRGGDLGSAIHEFNAELAHHPGNQAAREQLAETQAMLNRGANDNPPSSKAADPPERKRQDTIRVIR